MSHFDDCRTLIQELKASLSDVEVIQKDPETFISVQFYELNRLVDLRRETLFQEIQQRSSQMIAEIAVAHKECLDCKDSHTSG